MQYDTGEENAPDQDRWKNKNLRAIQ